jgi:hypothetical protein
VADQRYKSPAKLEHERRQELLRILRQVSVEAAAEVGEPTSGNLRRYNRVYSRRLAELLAEQE